MSLRGDLITVLQGVDGLVPATRKRPITIERPSWEVLVDGYGTHGNTLKQQCTVRLWTGLDDDPLAEGMFERWSEIVLAALLEQADCMLPAGPFQRLPPANPVGYAVEFVVGEIQVVEA